MKIDEVFDRRLLQLMLDDGFVKQQMHPNGMLAILNYTPRAQYGRVWNEVTSQCRGLIYDLTTDEVIARPFPKFFNLGEHSDGEIPMEPFEVYEKMDGSLGILYHDGRDWAVATRGSFTSEQAQWATAWLRNLSMPPARPSPNYWEPRPGWTYLFEIIYPANRIVVDYHGSEALVLLDVIDNKTGQSRLTEALAQRPWAWLGPVVKEYDGFGVLEELLAAEAPDNAEGYVIRFESGMRVKVKHDEYVRLHRIVTGVSTKTVWEYLSQGKSFEELLDRVPDEFFEWVQFQTAGLVGAFEGIRDLCLHDFAELQRDLGPVTSPEGVRAIRKDFAMAVVDHPHKDVLFRMLDGKSYERNIWQKLRPAYERPFVNQSEDVA